MKSLEAIIFDFDGVLADTEKEHFRVITLTLKKLCPDIKLNWTEYKKKYIGKPDLDVVTHICKKYQHEFKSDKIIFEKIVPIDLDSILMFDGAINLIKKAKRVDLPIGIASSSKKTKIKNILFKYNMLSFIDAIISIEDVIESKPSPECYQKCLFVLNEKFEKKILPENTVVIEDSIFGVLSAKSVGFKVIGLTTYYSSKMMKNAGASICYNDINKVTLPSLNFK